MTGGATSPTRPPPHPASLSCCSWTSLVSCTAASGAAAGRRTSTTSATSSCSPCPFGRGSSMRWPRWTGSCISKRPGTWGSSISRRRRRSSAISRSTRARSSWTDPTSVRSNLVESRGELFYVHIFLKGFTYQIDLSGPTLRELEELGDRVFLLSYPNTQLLCSASRYGLKGNRVYFVRNATGELDGITLYVYDMDGKSLRTVRRSREELVGDPFWLLPSAN
ncbi:hypothetical protein C2845_PM07G30780 [Panicum miliaceum]|uniref:KIB1-4 beta-propeller domain-containing protein n=1 Tax=Panicum miliaceum TaxID=4540 RepID=A0A3L6STA0_PANMI|nr:hypothetical protein C2845_PM07G30780 [Panicum miliaceum]